MAIVIFLVGFVLAVLLLYVVTVKAVEIIGVFALLALGIVVVAVGYVSLIVGGICVAALYQLWGGANIGWAIAVSGLIGLATAWTLLRVVVRKVRSFAVRVKTWFNPRNVLIQGDTDERLVDGYHN